MSNLATQRRAIYLDDLEMPHTNGVIFDTGITPEQIKAQHLAELRSNPERLRQLFSGVVTDVFHMSNGGIYVPTRYEVRVPLKSKVTPLRLLLTGEDVITRRVIASKEERDYSNSPTGRRLVQFDELGDVKMQDTVVTPFRTLTETNLGGCVIGDFGFLGEGNEGLGKLLQDFSMEYNLQFPTPTPASL